MLGMHKPTAADIVVGPTHAEIQANPHRYSDEQKAAALLAEIDKMPPAEQKRVLMYIAGIPEDQELQTVILRAPNGQLKAQLVSLEDAARIKGMGAAGFQTASFTNRRARRIAKAKAKARRSK